MVQRHVHLLASLFAAVAFTATVTPGSATPANKAALVKHYDRFLAKSLNACTTCHLPSENKHPETLAEFPHNPFGDRLRHLGEEAEKSGRKLDIPQRLADLAKEDSDRDGVANETELLLGHNPGNAKDTPTSKELVDGKKQLTEWAKTLTAYRWKPFEPVKRPEVPTVRGAKLRIRNPIDAFIAAEQQAHKLTPRPESTKEVLLRRVYLDLIGLSPTPEEMAAFLADKSPNAYEKAVDQLLASPRYGERWARHWMDVWRYSDWTGYQGVPRDSKPHIWRWRDWIIESLNADKGYDRMVKEMLAADELAPTDEDALRATGFLVRNFKSLSRERWLEDTIGHTFQAFQGLTMNCAKCHEHMYDPISQREYYEIRAIFEPHQIRTDRVPGVVDTDKTGDGLVRVYDASLDTKTYVMARGDERRRLTNEVIQPNVPRIFGAKFDVQPVTLPLLAVRPDKRDFVVRDDLAAAEKSLADARARLAELQAGTKTDTKQKAVPKTVAAAAAAAVAKLPPQLKPLPAAKTVAEAERNVALAEARVNSFKATLAAEKLESQKDSPEWKQAAEAAVIAQRQAAVLEARLAVADAEKALKAATAEKTIATAKKTLATAEKTLATAEKDLQAPVTTKYAPNKFEAFPSQSTGRRLALANWFASPENPLTARVAVNHLWAHHFGRGLVPTLNEFGRNGQPPSHPQLLDWLAAEFMARGWKMKELHRLIVTSSTYRMASTPDAANAKLDRDNVYLWRMNSRRMEAEIVRDNVLHVSGSLDLTMGGPEIDNKLGLTSKRRSVYLRIAPEKEVEFIKIFDGPNPVECYARPVTVMPHQALALANSELTFAQADVLAKALTTKAGNDDAKFIRAAYERVLARPPTKDEVKLCSDFLKQPGRAPERARENLVMVLFNHNDFVTIR